MGVNDFNAHSIAESLETEQNQKIVLFLSAQQHQHHLPHMCRVCVHKIEQQTHSLRAYLEPSPYTSSTLLGCRSGIGGNWKKSPMRMSWRPHWQAQGWTNLESWGMLLRRSFSYNPAAEFDRFISWKPFDREGPTSSGSHHLKTPELLPIFRSQLFLHSHQKTSPFHPVPGLCHPFQHPVEGLRGCPGLVPTGAAWPFGPAGGTAPRRAGCTQSGCRRRSRPPRPTPATGAGEGVLCGTIAPSLLSPPPHPEPGVDKKQERGDERTGW